MAGSSLFYSRIGAFFAQHLRYPVKKRLLIGTTGQKQTLFDHGQPLRHFVQALVANAYNVFSYITYQKPCVPRSFRGQTDHFIHKHMKTNHEVVVDIWKSHSNYLAKKSVELKAVNVVDYMANLFCPGPYYYYILDSPTLTL